MKEISNYKLIEIGSNKLSTEVTRLKDTIDEKNQQVDRLNKEILFQKNEMRRLGDVDLENRKLLTKID